MGGAGRPRPRPAYRAVPVLVYVAGEPLFKQQEARPPLRRLEGGRFCTAKFFLARSKYASERQANWRSQEDAAPLYSAGAASADTKRAPAFPNCNQQIMVMLS